MTKSIKDSYQISFWGPSYSGKTWLFHAFLYRIKKINDRLEKSMYRMSVLDKKGKEVRAESPIDFGYSDKPEETVIDSSDSLGFKIQPTQDKIQGMFYFKRFCVRQDGLISRVNTHEHNIATFDEQGMKFEPIHNKLDEVGVNKRDAAWETVANSRFIVLALNCDLSSNVASSQGNIVRVNSLVGQLRQLKEMLTEQPAGKYIAACLTKVDTLGELIIEFYNKEENQAELRNLLISSFGKRYTEEIFMIIDEIRKKHQVEIFATSASGYITKDGKRVRNLGDNRNGLADPTHWEPEEVEKPFFWIFEAMERQRLCYVSPSANLFNMVMGKNTVLEQRVALYKPYSYLLRLAESAG
jgi:hypothetical protein